MSAVVIANDDTTATIIVPVRTTDSNFDGWSLVPEITSSGTSPNDEQKTSKFISNIYETPPTITETTTRSRSSSSHTTETPATTAQPSAQAFENAGLDYNAKIGIALGVVFGALLIAFTAFFLCFCWRKRSLHTLLTEGTVEDTFNGTARKANTDMEQAEKLQPPAALPVVSHRNARRKDSQLPGDAVVDESLESEDLDEWLPHKTQGVVR